MSWWGKAIGGALGFTMGGPLGAALGAMLGHSFDKGVDQTFDSKFDATQQEKVQGAFFSATFTIMGKLAKADGQVSPEEISMAEQVMVRMGLTDALRQSAVNLFQQGKQPDFDWRGALLQFKSISGAQRNLKQMFLEIQVGAALADGTVHPAEKDMLIEMAQTLGFSARVLEQLLLMVKAQQYFNQSQNSGYHSHSQSSQHTAQPSIEQLNQAYQLLGVAQQDDDKSVKRAYRRLMSQHHPDKLVAKGLPEEMIKVATQKTQEIKTAYDLIMQSRR